MKISRKTVIIAIVVAVAAYLLWKRSKENGGGTSSSGSADPDPTSLDYILSHIDFTSAERNKIKSLREACEASKTTRQYYEGKANAKGRPFDQQLVLEAIWQLYTRDNEWIVGPDGTKTYGWKLQQKVLDLEK